MDPDDFVNPPKLITLGSEGGPHDDESYLAGYAMGALDAILGNASWMAGNLGARHLYDEILNCMIVAEINLEQADLIAMRHGYTSKFAPWEGHPGFHWMRVKRGTVLEKR